MSTKNFLYTAGWGSILAGLIWIAVALMVVYGTEIFNGAILDYLGILAAALMLVVALALYLQGGHKVVGTVALALGSASLALGLLLYAIAFDPEDGAAFMLFFLGTIVQGLGLAFVGYGFRSRGESTRWGTTLLILGIILMLAFPLLFFIDFGIGMNLSTRTSDLLWASIMAVQAISWIIAGRLASVGSPRVDEQSVEMAG